MFSTYWYEQKKKIEHKFLKKPIMNFKKWKLYLSIFDGNAQKGLVDLKCNLVVQYKLKVSLTWKKHDSISKDCALYVFEITALWQI